MYCVQLLLSLRPYGTRLALIKKHSPRFHPRYSPYSCVETEYDLSPQQETSRRRCKQTNITKYELNINWLLQTTLPSAPSRYGNQTSTGRWVLVDIISNQVSRKFLPPLCWEWSDLLSVFWFPEAPSDVLCPVRHIWHQGREVSQN